MAAGTLTGVRSLTIFNPPAVPGQPRLLARLLRDRAGNTLAMIAAAVIPLLAMAGGGVDMGRSYLSQSRLQQACDAGVLAARKKLGSQVAPSGALPADVTTVGNRFFNLNFRDGSYGTKRRTFQMTLEPDYAISGVATVSVPTTIMTMFGYNEVAVDVKCEARLNFSNTDIMFVLDTTGSMAETNPGDTKPRIDVMRDVVSAFHAQMEGSKSPGTVLRYGFVPYATNVNVGSLLAQDWMVTNWKYQSREQIIVGTQSGTTTYDRAWTYVSGAQSAPTQTDNYAATYHPPVDYNNPGSTTIDAHENVVVIPPSSGTYPAYYTCDKPDPAGTVSYADTVGAKRTEPFVGPPAGTRTIEPHTLVRNGSEYGTTLASDRCLVSATTYTQYTETFERVTDPTLSNIYNWHYAQLAKNVSNWPNEYNGCIEERATYEIGDFANVDLTKALDLDLDLVPTGDDATKWRPMYPDLIFARSLKWDGTGAFTTAEQTTTDDYIMPKSLGTADCPAPAQKLKPMTDAELSSYLANLHAGGATYHDIGMIWGGRLLSPTGLFAAENQGVSGKPTNRNLIFLTDGTTQTLDVSYGPYGLEPLDRRRWTPASARSLNDVVEKRFGVACNEVKKRNITVWVIGFGTSLNPIMTDCAGPGHSFEAKDSAELSKIFNQIALQMGDLRISK